MKFLKIASAMLMAGTALTAQASDKLHNEFSDNEIIQILQDDGYNSVSQVEEGMILVKVNGDNYVIFNDHMDGDLTSYYGISDIDVSLVDINGWNRDYRLTRAYIDDENDPVIEADLLGNAGITEQQVSDFFEVFVDSVDVFINYLNQHEK